MTLLERNAALSAVGDLLDLVALAADGTAVTGSGDLVRMLAVSTVNPSTLGDDQVNRLAHAFGALVNGLAAGERLTFLVEATPIQLDRLLARSRVQTDATAAAVERGPHGRACADALKRLAAAHEESIEQHARRDAARELTAYVVVPTPAKGELRRSGAVTPDVHAELSDRVRRQVDRVREAIHAAELACEPVDGLGVFEFLWRRLNPDAAARGELPPRPELDELDGARDREQADARLVQLIGALAGAALDAGDQRFLRFEDTLEQVLYVGALPEATWFGWLEEALAVPRPFVLAVHVRALDRITERDRLRAKHRRVFGVNRGREETSKPVHPDAKTQEVELEAAVVELGAAQRARPFEVSIYQAIREPGPDADPRELAAVCDRAARTLGAAVDASVYRGALRQIPLWRSTLPLGRDYARRRHLYFTRHVADTLPLAASGASSPQGLPVGFSTPGETVQLLNFWDPAHTNHALAINGKSGSGKTLCTIALVSQLLCHGAQGVVIDRADHYSFLASLIPGARHLSIGHSDSPHAINPWDVEDPSRVEAEQITYLVDLHALLLGELDARRGAYGLTDRERIVLEDAIGNVYTRVARRRGTAAARESDLHAALLERAKAERARGAESYAEIAEDLAWRVRRFTVDGPYGHLLDRETTVDLQAPLTVFDTRDVSRQFAAGVMYLIGEHVAAGIARRQAARSAVALPPDVIFGRSFLVLEEVWAMVDNEISGRWVSDMARRSRHLGLALIAVTQQLDDLAASEYGKALLRQSSMQMFFHQQGDDLEVLRDACRLSPREVNLISRLKMVRGRYSQAYWANGTRGRTVIECRHAPRVYWLATSDPIRDTPRRTRAVQAADGDPWAALDALIKEAI